MLIRTLLTLMVLSIFAFSFTMISDVQAITTSDTMYTCGAAGGGEQNIHLRNKTDGTIISSNTWAVTGNGITNVEGCNGLAQDPTDGQWWAIIQAQNGARHLSTVDVTTGIGTSIGILPQQPNSLIINSTGSFFVTQSAGFGDNNIMIANKTDGSAIETCVMSASSQPINAFSYNWITDRIVVINSPDDDVRFNVKEITDYTTPTCTSVDTLGTFTASSYDGDNFLYPYGWAYHTGDDSWYSFSLDESTNSEQYSIIDNTYNALLLNAQAGGDAFPVYETLTTDTKSRGVAFELILTPPEPDFDEDGIPDSTDTDDDNDGIEDIIDPAQFDDTNDSFDDGTTDGTIIRGDQKISAIDLTVPDGVRISSLSPTIVTSNTMFTCDSPSGSGNEIHVSDPTRSFTTQIISSSTLNISGITSTGCAGIAQDPISGNWYALIRDGFSGAGFEYLSIVDPTTGLGTAIGLVDDAVNGLAFNSTGHLFAQASSGGTGDSIFRLDKTTGLIQETCAIPHGDLGNQPSTIGYNWDLDELISLFQSNTSGFFMYRMDDMASCTWTNLGIIDWSDSSFGEPPPNFFGQPQSMTFDTVDNEFLLTQRSGDTDEGVLVSITATAPFIAIKECDEFCTGHEGDDIQRGIGFELITEPEPATITACGGQTIENLDGGETVDITCGSINVKVINGDVDLVVVSTEGDTADVSLDTADEFFFDDETFTLESTAGTAEVTVVAEDETTTEITLTEDNAITVDPETAIITADPDNPTDVVVVVDGEEETIPPGISVAPSIEQALETIINDLNSIVSENPGTSLADKVEDASDSVQTALDELNKNPPDNQAAAGTIEGAISSLEDAIKDNGLDQTQGEQLIDQILTVSRQLASDAISVKDTAKDTAKVSKSQDSLHLMPFLLPQIHLEVMQEKYP